MVIRMNHVSGELLPSTTREARFQSSAKSAATMDLTPPRSRRAARSCSNNTRKMAKIRTPAECPSVLTSRDSFTVQSYRMGEIGDVARLGSDRCGADFEDRALAHRVFPQPRPAVLSRVDHRAAAADDRRP